MHIRFSTCMGMEVLDESSQAILGYVSGILIHPDTGKIEAFHVQGGQGFGRDALLLPAVDVIHFGARMSVRSEDVLCHPDDILRLKTLLDDPRSVLHQRIRTESGHRLGVCRDVQFHTEFLQLEWLFPKQFFRWRPPIAATSILEVRSDAIIVRDPLASEPAEEEQQISVLDAALPDVPEPKVSRKAD